MTVYRLTENRLKIALTYTEITLGFGGLRELVSMNEKVKLRLKLLISNVANSFYIQGEKIKARLSITADKGCFIELCFANPYLYYFHSSEQLIKSVINIFPMCKNIKSDLFLMDNGYRILSSAKLNGFCECESQNGIHIAYTKEYGKPLILNNAIYRFGKAFIKDF